MAGGANQKKPKGAGAPSRPQNAITDPRFANIQTDPRFRLPSRRKNQVTLDKRFSHMLADDDFTQRASVDRYGRKLPKSAGRKELEKYYRVEGEEEEEEEAELGERVDESGEDDDVVAKELARADRKYDPARQGGFSESESSSDEEDEEVEEVEEEYANGMVPAEEQTDVPMGEVTKRIAVVNLDWDNIRAVDLMAVAASFCPSSGYLTGVSVYPSEFGKERMERETLEGPPRELFTNTANADKGDEEDDASDDEDSDSDPDASGSEDEAKIKSKMLSEATSSTADIDSHALRAYQLSRLRYYYAIITCSDTDSALALYNDMDGREYLSTANFFDLRFVPDDVTFDDLPRDECTKVPAAYRPNEFVTEALTHSKVRLTWDEEDAERKEVQKRAFSRQEVDENDLKAYLGSDSDSDDGDTDAATASAGAQPKPSKAEAARQKLRAALGLSADAGGKSSRKTDSQPAGGMQITFTAGLSDNKTGHESVFANKPSDVAEETTMERYVRKEKERKARRRAKSKAAREGEGEGDDSDADPAHETTSAATTTHTKLTTTTAPADNDAEAAEADPFADPFFTDPAAANLSAKRATKKAQRQARDARDAAAAAATARERAELELLMADDADNPGAATAHFDMAEIRRAEKAAGRRGGKGRRARAEVGEARQDGFEMDVADPRFSGVFESHEYAIDPSNPRFSGTKGMKKLLEEGRRKRRHEGDGEEVGGDGEKKKKAVRSKGGDGEIEELVRRVKSKR